MYENYLITEIRILVASGEMEFEKESDFRKFIEIDLPQNYIYRYRERGIKGKDILILFYHHENEQIVGCGILEDRKKYKPEEIDDDYHGELRFYPKTVMNIEGITKQEIKEISPIPKDIIQGSPKVDIKKLPEILSLIEHKRKNYRKMQEGSC